MKIFNLSKLLIDLVQESKWLNELSNWFDYWSECLNSSVIDSMPKQWKIKQKCKWLIDRRMKINR